jgi:hypothetical protein
MLVAPYILLYTVGTVAVLVLVVVVVLLEVVVSLDDFLQEAIMIADISKVIMA